MAQKISVAKQTLLQTELSRHQQTDHLTTIGMPRHHWGWPMALPSATSATWSPIYKAYIYACIIVCVEVLQPSQPNGVMSSAVSLPSHTFTRQAYSSKRFTSIVHILSPETDNCPSRSSGRERMTVENIS